MKSLFSICIIALIFLACTNKQESAKVSKYPATQKVDTVDTYFGTKVLDPYRWLENDTTKETGDWVKSQNDVTFSYLKNISYRETVKKRLEELNDYEKLSAPFREGGLMTTVVWLCATKINRLKNINNPKRKIEPEDFSKLNIGMRLKGLTKVA